MHFMGYKDKKMVFFFLLQMMVLLFVMLTAMVHALPVFTGIKYFLFQLTGIFLPGLALFTILKIRVQNTLHICAWSYCLGVIFLIAEYLLLMPAGFSVCASAAEILMTVVSLIVIYKYADFSEAEADRVSWMLCLGLLLIILLIGLLTVSFVNTMPDESGGTGYYVDWLFWAGNNISFTKGFPAQNFRLYGETFRYHHFSSMILAQSSLITGIDVVELTFYFSFILPAVLLVFAGYTFFSSVIRKKAFIFLALLILLFTEGTSVTYVWHLYFCPFGYDYGYIFGMAAVTFLIYIVREDGGFNCKYAFLTFVLIAVTTGCKGPVGSVVLMGYGIAAIAFICQKQYKKGFCYGMIWLAAFLIVYYAFIVSESAWSEQAGLQILGIEKAFQKNPWAQEWYTSICNIADIPYDTARFMALVCYVFQVNPAGMVLFLIGCGAFISRAVKKKECLLLAVFLGIDICGIVLTLISYQSGFSQMYFVMSVLPYAICSGMLALDQASVHRSLFQVSLAVLTLICLCRCGSRFWIDYMIPQMDRGIQCISGNLGRADYSNYFVYKSDFEAYRWIREHTDPRALIVLDCFVDTKLREQGMAAGVFSERYIWNDGTYAGNRKEVERRRDLVVEFFMLDNKAALEELKSAGVSYFIQTRTVWPDIVIDPRDAECVFTNDRIRVYELK